MPKLEISESLEHHSMPSHYFWVGHILGKIMPTNNSSIRLKNTTRCSTYPASYYI